MKRIFIIESDSFPQESFELIHRYIRKQLDPHTKHLEIKSIPLNIEMERLIFSNHNYN